MAAPVKTLTAIKKQSILSPTTKPTTPANKAQLAKEQQLVKEHRMLQKGKAMDQFKKQVTSGKVTKATKDMPLEQRMYLKKKIK